MMGYSVVYLLEQNKSVRIHGSRYVEANVLSKDIVIKVPVAVPYQTSWDSPEPAAGQIEHQGEFYEMTSRQLINDTLYIHCEFDQNARDQFMNLVSKVNDQITGDDSESQKQTPSSVLKSFLKEYMLSGKKHVFYLLDWTTPLRYQRAAAGILRDSHRIISSPPPDLA